MSVGFWLVAQTKPQQERWAAENAARQGYEWYLPMTRVRRTNNIYKIQCLFPRYLFVKTKGAWRSLLGTFGVTSLVMTGEKPSELAESVIERLRARQGADGFITLPNALEPRFKANDAVRVNGGPMSGYTGIVTGMAGEARVKVLLDFLGRKTPVLIGDEHLEMS